VTAARTTVLSPTGQLIAAAVIGAALVLAGVWRGDLAWVAAGGGVLGVPGLTRGNSDADADR
jgi:hypothetical protein